MNSTPAPKAALLEFAAVSEAEGYGRPAIGLHGDAFIYQRDQDRYEGWLLARRLAASAPVESRPRDCAHSHSEEVDGVRICSQCKEYVFPPAARQNREEADWKTLVDAIHDWATSPRFAGGVGHEKARQSVEAVIGRFRAELPVAASAARQGGEAVDERIKRAIAFLRPWLDTGDSRTAEGWAVELYMILAGTTPPAAAAGREDDTARLDWLESQAVPGQPWQARMSSMGRGFRLHQGAAIGYNTARRAIDAARASTPEGDGPDGEDGPWAEGWAQRYTPEAVEDALVEKYCAVALGNLTPDETKRWAEYYSEDGYYVDDFRAMIRRVVAALATPAARQGGEPYGWIEPSTGNFVDHATKQKLPEDAASFTLAVFTAPPTREGVPEGMESAVAEVLRFAQRIEGGYTVPFSSMARLQRAAAPTAGEVE